MPEADIQPLSHPGPAPLEKFYFIFLFKDFIYLFMRATQEREREAETRQREKSAPRRAPDVGLDPGSPGSVLGLKAALNR